LSDKRNGASVIKVIGVDPGSGRWDEAGRATGGTGIVMVDGDELVHYETMTGDPGDTVDAIAVRITSRLAELVADEPRLWTLAVEFPLNPVRRSRAVNESCVIAGIVYAWGIQYDGWCADARYVEAGRFPKSPPPRELVGRRRNVERLMKEPAPHLCRSRDHEQDAYSIARHVQGVLEAEACAVA
jgi:hypothetical protein